MCKATTELTKIVSGGRECDLVLIEPSKLNLNDDFMNYCPKKDENEVKIFKSKLTDVIKIGIGDFYRPTCDPTFANNTRTKICYVAGACPAVGRSYEDWVILTKKFYPKQNSRNGTKYKYIAFGGWLIKKLVESGWSKKEAWNAVCTNSNVLGLYLDSENSRGSFLEVTKSREILGLLYDLGGTCKLLSDDYEDDVYWIAGGHYNTRGSDSPLMYIRYGYHPNCPNDKSVGWTVIPK